VVTEGSDCRTGPVRGTSLRADRSRVIDTNQALGRTGFQVCNTSVATAFIATACFGGEAKVKGERLGVKLRVVNETEVPADVLRRAIDTASKILAQADVEALWVNCPGEKESETRVICNQKLGRADFWLHLVVGKMPGADHDTLGSALVGPLGNSSAYAYYRDIEKFAKNHYRDTSLVLAAIIAHEVGHLLLGDRSNSRSGIMSAELTSRNLDLAQRSHLFFTRDQIRQIQVQVTAIQSANR
jgi:hypothetical protein